MAVLRRRYDLWVRPGNREHRTHDAMHPSCTAMLIGWPQQVQRCRKEMRGKMENTSLMTRWWWSRRSRRIYTCIRENSLWNCTLTPSNYLMVTTSNVTFIHSFGSYSMLTGYVSVILQPFLSETSSNQQVTSDLTRLCERFQNFPRSWRLR